MTAMATRPVDRAPSVGDQVGAIETEMRLASQGLSVEAVVRIEERFQELKSRALRENAAVAPHMARLRELRAGFEALKAPLAEWLIDELHRVRGAIHAAERREEMLKETVVWLSRTCGRDEVRGGAARAEVRSAVKHAVPHAGTAARAELERIVREQNLWAELSVLWGPKVMKAIDAGRFAGAAREEVARLCPRGTGYSVRTFEIRGGPGAGAPTGPPTI